MRRADGTLDEAGFKGGAADVMVQSLRLQVPWAEAARRAGRGEPRYLGPGWGVVRRSTHLIRAAIRGDVVRVRQLVQLCAPLDLVDKCGDSALHWACLWGYTDVAEALLDGKFEGRGAAINKRTNHGMTPLMGASWQGHEDVVRLLLARGANVALRDSAGETALGMAIRDSHPAIVALLKAAGAPM